MRNLKPAAFIEEFYPDSGICTKTIINWIKRGKLRGKQTPTGRWLVVVGEQEHLASNDDIEALVSFLEG